MTSHMRKQRTASQRGVNGSPYRLSFRCLAQGLSMENLAECNDIVRPLETLKKHQPLLLQGMPFTSLFAVRSGSLKQVTAMESGESLVTAFFLPGEVIGLDAIAEHRYPGSVVSLEPTTVCELPFDLLDELSTRVPELRRQLQGSLSQEVHNERLRMRLLRRTAEVRLACFLVAMSERLRRRGYSPCHCRLAMSRGDIGSYLGLTEETVGRTLVQFQKQGLLGIQGREFYFPDLPGLSRLAETSGRRSARK
jgi:CRP/FNR family transcriptional regulator, anaerobic regulatory protein